MGLKDCSRLGGIIMAEMSIQILVDAQLLADMVAADPSKAGSQDNPQSLGAWSSSDKYIYMIAKNSYVVSDQAQSELRIQVTSGTNINWYMGTFDNNTSYTPILYKGVFNPSDGITPIQYVSMQTIQYLPPGTDPLATLQGYTSQVFNADARITKIGQTIQYTFSFKLVDNNKGGRVVGYFSWDPFINVQGL
jgi:hypothetical protein